MYSLLFLKAGLVLKGPPASIMAYESVFQTGTTGNTFTRLRMIRFKESSLSLVTFCWEENINHIWREKCVKHFLLCYLSKEARKLLSLPHNPAKKSISSYTCSFDDISGELVKSWFIFWREPIPYLLPYGSVFIKKGTIRYFPTQNRGGSRGGVIGVATPPLGKIF